MRSKTLYKHRTVKDLKKHISEFFNDDDTVEYFEIQAKKGHSTGQIMSRRVDE